jgi:hypothetical protein
MKKVAPPPPNFFIKCFNIDFIEYSMTKLFNISINSRAVLLNMTKAFRASLTHQEGFPTTEPRGGGKGMQWFGEIST